MAKRAAINVRVSTSGWDAALEQRPKRRLCQRASLRQSRKNKGLASGFCAIISGKLSLREGKRTEFE
jgi:hypothetical protein